MSFKKTIYYKKIYFLCRKDQDVKNQAIIPEILVDSHRNLCGVADRTDRQVSGSGGQKNLQIEKEKDRQYRNFFMG